MLVLVIGAHLLESLVVHKAGRILWDLELPFLNLLAELPVREFALATWSVEKATQQGLPPYVESLQCRQRAMGLKGQDSHVGRLGRRRRRGPGGLPQKEEGLIEMEKIEKSDGEWPFFKEGQ